jgi:phytoene dehydrogenase-like protein
VPEGAVDLRSGVLSAPNNFIAEEEPMPEGILRVTVLANPERWTGLPEAEYREAKQHAAADAIRALDPLYPDWNAKTVYRDIFTPRTIAHFTGHDNGAVYGAPKKHRTGATGVEGLSLIGTDQGYLGVVGAMMSGISMANLHGLAPSSRAIPSS